MNISRRTRTALIRATDNWLSRVYLAAVTAATGYFLFDAFFVDHPDASMAAVVPWLLTAPLSLLYTLLPAGTLSGASTGLFTALHLAGIAFAALANAAFMGHVVHRLRQPFPGTAPSA
ncbi:SCO4225 family membrane protein [Streptomyces sp. NPDC090798]|uniref:SCO4225 family membrane protein n=1 Tax=Streptomyces sp. NPDC090798 TaxID=3365968 RepID=UPI00381C2C5C